jgi:hypothetical protein
MPAAAFLSPAQPSSAQPGQGRAGRQTSAVGHSSDGHERAARGNWRTPIAVFWPVSANSAESLYFQIV